MSNGSGFDISKLDLPGILGLLPTLIALGVDVATMIGNIRETANKSGRTTPEEWAQIHAIEAAQQKIIDERLKTV